MRILVTGGAGFLGSALANALARQGHEVLVLDDLSAGDQTRLDAKVFFHRGEITNRPKLWTLLQGVQCVYHLAARVLVAESILYPREYNDVNVGGTVALLEAMRDVGVPRLVFTSSGAVYGAQVEQPVSETTTPNPQSPYAVSKLAAEYYVHTIGALWGTTTVALRIFHTTEDSGFLKEVYQDLIDYFYNWLTHEHDRDEDGIPEWDHPLQIGAEDHPVYSYWHEWTMGVEISTIESPALNAFLYQSNHHFVRN